MIGQRLSQYRIEQRLGAGGMGVVYRAYDERLQRTVGIKLLGEVTNTTPEERTRLLQEARAASHLAHPHICTIYEVADTGTRAFIVMEFVEGRPLSEVIPHDGLPFDQVVRYGVEIASAIDHAHARGVIHRDLKTSNVVISPTAGAKVLDFGLARRVELHAVDTDTRSVAEDVGLTGTPAYLAPEVLLGQPAAMTSDIWALGVVLYEMANGELPFTGRNQIELTSTILTAPVRPFSARVPASIRAIIQRCLAKEPAQRYQRAGEVRAALEAISSGEAVAAPVEPPRASPLMRNLAIGGIALALAGGVLATWLRSRETEPAPGPVITGQLVRLIESEGRAFDPSLSPDGRTICYVVEDDSGRRDLFTTRVASGGRIPLTNDDAIEGEPAVSPDGDWVAFSRRERAALAPEIRIIPSLGGEVRAVIPAATSPAWSPDGSRLVYLRQANVDAPVELTTSNVDGSNPRPLLRSDGRYPFLRHPAWSADGATIAIVRGTGGIAGEIWLVSAEGGEPRRAIEEPSTVFSDSPVFTHDGRGIVHVSNRGGATNVWQLPVNGGPPVRLTTGPGPDQGPTLAADGSIAFVNTRWRNTLDVFDLAAGTSRTILSHSPFLWGPTPSPDGAEIAFSRGEVDGSWQIWTVPTDGGTARRLTSGEGGGVYPRYSPDGAFIYFHTWGQPRMIGKVPRTGGPATMLPIAGGAYAAVSQDGKWIVFTKTAATGEQVFVSPVDQPGNARLLTASPGTVPAWSPDGKRIAFAPDRSFSKGIVIINSDGTAERRLTTEGGWPVWFSDGRQIGYLSIDGRGNQQYRIVDATTGATRALPVTLRGNNMPFFPMPDGRRLVYTNSVHVSDEIWLLRPTK